MSQYKRTVEAQTSGSFFTISQPFLGSPLQFQPALGTKELDALVDAFVPGDGSITQKRAAVSFDFFNAIEAAGLPFPAFRRYQLPVASPSQSLSTSPYASHSPETAPGQAKKRSRTEDSTTTSSKRNPGFSIMTKEGVDITEYASRGPKSKEQREHAALMRKLKACPTCKRSKQRCDPSHHNIPGASPAMTISTPASAVPSLTSANTWNSRSSRPSISPRSALEDSFSQSPGQKLSSVAYAGKEFDSPPQPPLFSPTDMAFDSSLLDMDFNTFTNEFDDQFFNDLPATDFEFAWQDARRPVDYAYGARLGSTVATHTLPVLSSAQDWEGASVRLPVSQDWEAPAPPGFGNQAQILQTCPDPNLQSSPGGFGAVADFVLYPESPRGCNATIASDLSFSEESPIAKSMAFDFDGSYFRRPDSLSRRQRHPSSINDSLIGSPTSDNAMTTPDLIAVMDREPSDEKFKNGAYYQATTYLRRQHLRQDLSRGRTLSDELTIYSQTSNGTLNRSEDVSSDSTPSLISREHVRCQVCTNETWLSYRQEARREFRRHISNYQETMKRSESSLIDPTASRYIPSPTYDSQISGGIASLFANERLRGIRSTHSYGKKTQREAATETPDTVRIGGSFNAKFDTQSIQQNTIYIGSRNSGMQYTGVQKSSFQERIADINLLPGKTTTLYIPQQGATQRGAQSYWEGESLGGSERQGISIARRISNMWEQQTSYIALEAKTQIFALSGGFEVEEVISPVSVISGGIERAISCMTLALNTVLSFMLSSIGDSVAAFLQSISTLQSVLLIATLTSLVLCPRYALACVFICAKSYDFSSLSTPPSSECDQKSNSPETASHNILESISPASPSKTDIPSLLDSQPLHRLASLASTVSRYGDWAVASPSSPASAFVRRMLPVL